MSDHVQFDEDQVGMPRAPMSHSGPMSFAAANFNQQQKKGMAGWLVRHGIMNSDSGAKVALISVICFNFLAAGFVIYFFVLKQ